MSSVISLSSNSQSSCANINCQFHFAVSVITGILRNYQKNVLLIQFLSFCIILKLCFKLKILNNDLELLVCVLVLINAKKSFELYTYNCVFKVLAQLLHDIKCVFENVVLSKFVHIYESLNYNAHYSFVNYIYSNVIVK